MPALPSLVLPELWESRPSCTTWSTDASTATVRLAASGFEPCQLRFAAPLTVNKQLNITLALTSVDCSRQSLQLTTSGKYSDSPPGGQDDGCARH
eukprot:1315999-Prymnesium_polylepis.1